MNVRLTFLVRVAVALLVGFYHLSTSYTLQAQPNTAPKSAAIPADLGFPVLRKLPPSQSPLNTPIYRYEINGLPGIQAQPGDNVITLAYYGKISVRQFLDYNDMTEQDVVRAGDVYYLVPKQKRAAIPFHVLDRGQTLRDVARLYGVQLNALLKYNYIEPNQQVREGRLIWLQQKRPKNQPVEFRPLPPPLTSPASASAPKTTSPDSVEAPSRPGSPSAVSAPTRPTVTSVNSAATPLPATQVKGQPSKPTARGGNGPAQGMKTYFVIERLPVASTKAPDSLTNKPVGSTSRLHVVQAGQTIYRIALLHNVTVAQLMRWNNLRGPTLQVGQQLIIRR